MAVITISRQLGSLGSEIAQQVAHALNYDLIWRELVNQAALRAGAPEAALATIDELGLLNLHLSAQDRQAYRQAVKQILEELAVQGNKVIIGRGGQVVLANHPNALHVRIIAPASLRAERISQKQQISLECAQAQVETSDSHRISYMKRFFSVRLDNPTLYHLIINSGRIDVENAARLICQAASTLIHAPQQL